MSTERLSVLCVHAIQTEQTHHSFYTKLQSINGTAKPNGTSSAMQSLQVPARYYMRTDWRQR